MVQEEFERQLIALSDDLSLSQDQNGKLLARTRELENSNMKLSIEVLRFYNSYLNIGGKKC